MAKLAQGWKYSAGYIKARLSLNGHELLVCKHERLGNRWKSSKFFHGYLNGKYLGHSTTLNGAKLMCILYLQELTQ